DEKQCNDFIGGYGIGANILFEQQKAGVDPLGHDAMLGFVTGPLTGTPALIGSRYTVVGKSPLTGTWGDANSGGDFGPHLKFAGYDAVFFKGISELPVYLNIENGKAVLRDADHLWGKDTSETEAILQSGQGKTARVACIGTAGENLSLISCIMNNKGRAAGRSGLGAVMGSKMLKAITVNGNLKVPIAYPAELKGARRRYLHQMKEAVIFLMINSGGTAGLMEFLHLTGEAPCKNWGGAATVDFADIEPLLGPAVDKLTEKRYGCWHCPI
ncbi:MAG: aldehyde ferredoxin oxidoreductase, partial [Deltaproteobacteria bacterium]|nr:aldehyde ferredoxin oxidoreductase [Deltaproteobacteria bacterium]